MSANYNEGKKIWACPNIKIWKLITCSYVNDMKCSNNFDKDEFGRKGNDDMMQHVKFNKSLFTPRWKALKKQGNNKYHLGAKTNFECWSERH